MAVIDYTVVATSLGRSLTDAEQAQVVQWIDDAELIIRLRLGDTVFAALDQEALAYVVREAVLARLRNPGGVTEESRQIDDFKVTRKLSSSVSITDEWWELLAPTTTSSAFTITPGTRATRAYDAERLNPWIAEP